jgi:hypothetical protein
MTINLKIELVKIFTIEFSLCSDKKPKKDESNEEAVNDQPNDGGSTGASK